MKTYRKTLRGRLDDLTRGLRERSRRAAAGTIAVIIGALGATALLATTLVLPESPLQRIFATPSGVDLESRFADTQRSEEGGGTGERTIEVDTRTSQGTDVLESDDRGPELAGDQVLGTVVASGSGGPDLVTNGAGAGSKNGGEGPKENQTGSTSGSGSGSSESSGSGSGESSGSGSGESSGSDTDGTVPATKPEDDEDDDDERDDDRGSRDDSDSGSSDSRDSRDHSRGSGGSKDSDGD